MEQGVFVVTLWRHWAEIRLKCCPGVLSRLDATYFKKWVVHAVSQAGFLPGLLI